MAFLTFPGKGNQRAAGEACGWQENKNYVGMHGRVLEALLILSGKRPFMETLFVPQGSNEGGFLCFPPPLPTVKGERTQARCDTESKA